MKYPIVFAVALATLPLIWGTAAQAEDGLRPPMQQAKEPSAKDIATWHKSMCGEHFAHETARLAYLQARLELTEQQTPAFRKWAEAESQTADQERDACLVVTPKSDGAPSIIEREAHMTNHLRIRLQGLDAARPALQALYEVLTPEQRAILDRPHEGHRGGHREGPMGEGMMTGDHRHQG